MRRSCNQLSQTAAILALAEIKGAERQPALRVALRLHNAPRASICGDSIS